MMFADPVELIRCISNSKNPPLVLEYQLLARVSSLGEFLLTN